MGPLGPVGAKGRSVGPSSQHVKTKLHAVLFAFLSGANRIEELADFELEPVAFAR